MKPGELLFMDNFGLQEAMTAIEVCRRYKIPYPDSDHAQIMDERMDSGTRPPDTQFNPSALLLPQEVCWILDRTFSAEVRSAVITVWR
jgi:hypothetical protein